MPRADVVRCVTGGAAMTLRQWLGAAQRCGSGWKRRDAVTVIEAAVAGRRWRGGGGAAAVARRRWRGGGGAAAVARRQYLKRRWRGGST
jgi:hypothetical protein